MLKFNWPPPSSLGYVHTNTYIINLPFLLTLSYNCGSDLFAPWTKRCGGVKVLVGMVDAGYVLCPCSLSVYTICLFSSHTITYKGSKINRKVSVESWSWWCFSSVVCVFLSPWRSLRLTGIRCSGRESQMMMITLITINSGLVPLIEGLCAQNYFRFEISVVCVHIFCFSFSEEKIC